MGGANALAGSLWPLPEWELASTIIRESTVHLIAHQCLRVFFRLGISSFVTENLVQSRSIMWMIVSTHLPASPSPEKHESKATEWRRDHPAVQAMTLNLTLNARRCLVGWGRGVGSHLLASYFFFALLLLASYFYFYCEHQDHEPYCWGRDCEHVHHLAGQVRPQLDVRKVGVWATSGGSPHGPENTFARLSLSASCLLLLKLLRLYPGQETVGCSLSLVFLYVGSI